MGVDSVARSLAITANSGVDSVRQMVEGLPKGLVYKGAVANYASLPSTGQKIGDTYTTLDTGAEYAWSKIENVEQWVEVGVHYTAGANVQINNNVISATDTTYTAGTGISISNNVISSTTTFTLSGTTLAITTA